MRRTGIILMIAALTAACAPRQLHWRRTNASDQQRQADIASCHSSARAEAKRQNATDRRLSPDATDASDQDTYRSNMGVYEHRKNLKALFNQCMANNGYRQDR